jgi:signal transduction histidine kinase
MAQEVLAGDVPPPIEYRARRSDGEVRILYQEAEGILDEAGKLAALIGVVRDVTQLRAAERKHEELEAQLFHSQKLEALGTLAGGIAHDLNNALMPVIGLTELVLRRLPADCSERKHLEHVCDAGRQARKLVQQVLAFGRKTVASKELVRLDLLVGEALGMVRASLPTTLQLRPRLAVVPPVLGDRGQLYQVLLNLVTNAAHAIGDRQGTVAIEVAAEGPYVRLSVEDDGCGMDEPTRLRIFEPFFTTKAVNEGTGLGLSVVHGIVMSHGGRIDVASRPGVGTRFDVWLPVHEVPGEAALAGGEVVT